MYRIFLENFAREVLERSLVGLVWVRYLPLRNSLGPKGGDIRRAGVEHQVVPAMREANSYTSVENPLESLGL